MSQPIEKTQLKKMLRKWLDDVSVKSACAIGIKNLTTKYTLEHPRVFVSKGRVVHEPVERVESEKASAALFTKEDYALTGSSGCLCYDISETEFMLCILWHVPVSEAVAENHFNVRCLRKGECNDSLFKYLSEDSKTADGEICCEENGFRMCACMGREGKSILIVDCFEDTHVGPCGRTEPVKVGKELESLLRQFLAEADVKTVCGIGINNLSGEKLHTPHIHIDGGLCAVYPPRELESEMASPSLFCKRKYSLKGTAGVLTYDIAGTKNMLAVMWSIPFSEFMIDNQFNVVVLNKAECNKELFQKLYDEAKAAKDGELKRENFNYQIAAHMETGSRAILIVDFSSRKASSWGIW